MEKPDQTEYGGNQNETSPCSEMQKKIDHTMRYGVSPWERGKVKTEPRYIVVIA